MHIHKTLTDKTKTYNSQLNRIIIYVLPRIIICSVVFILISFNFNSSILSSGGDGCIISFSCFCFTVTIIVLSSSSSKHTGVQ
ncbi:hypothetical protein MrNuV_ORF097 [Macrobrachium rosenbergii nudivirus]|nr:hypothetical protein MrNuV_ORF097 [Macrobrachium rosenbergii nudivirus]